MQNRMMIAFLLSLTGGCMALECSPGYKFKATLKDLTCNTKEKTVAACNAGCCEPDPLTCGGLDANITCPTDSYKAGDDAWKKKATTEAGKLTDCCEAVATCASSSYKCSSGYKKKAAATPATKCSGDAKTTCPSVCCEKDVEKCGGLAKPTCAAGTTYDESLTWTSKTTQATKDAWNNKAATDATKDTKCCTNVATCASAGYACPAGQKKKANVASTKCTKGPSSCPATCCEADNTKCGGLAASITCDAGKFKDVNNDKWKNKATTDAKKKADCCETIADCTWTTFKCDAGMKKRVDVNETDTCTGGPDTCKTTCCETDVQKCGGLSGITCSGNMYDESATFTGTTPKATSDAWKNVAATGATKNTACCTKKATCDAFKKASAAGNKTKTAALVSGGEHLLSGSFVFVGLSTLVSLWVI